MYAEAIDIGHHARIPAHLIAEIKKPRALQVFSHLMSLCNPSNPRVWIDQKSMASKLGIHRDTAGIWVRYLERMGYLVCVGFKTQRRIKEYNVNLKLKSEQPDSKPQNAGSGEIVGHTPVVSSEYVRRFHRNINKEKESEIKEQTLDGFSQIKFSDNEKISLRQQLKLLGVNHAVATKLMQGSEGQSQRIKNQIQHLRVLLKKGDEIANPSGWLVNAIKNNYALPAEIDPKAIKEKEESESLREAKRIAQSACMAKNEGNYEKAKELAQKSLLLAHNSEAKEVVEEYERVTKRQERLINAESSLSQEAKEEMLLKAQNEQLGRLCKTLQISQERIRQSAMYQNAVRSQFEEMLIEANPEMNRLSLAPF